METHKAPVVSASFEKSSNIENAEYDPFMKVLTIRFRTGGAYDYIDVEESIFKEMKKADSAGKFFHAKIRGKYDFLKRVETRKKESEKEQ
jgi:hypothetical protein